MVVDLERNDLGRVCEYGSVEVADHRYVEELPTLFHTISTVRGRLREGTSAIDVLRATFPGGSISGCPKIRAIEIIDELEPVRRHVYTGAIGFLGADDMRLSIAIRTMTVARGRLYYNVGSGIVADSDPAREYEETLQKAEGMRAAIARVG
jgi:para-aminobenzoate synthetase component 1